MAWMQLPESLCNVSVAMFKPHFYPMVISVIFLWRLAKYLARRRFQVGKGPSHQVWKNSWHIFRGPCSPNQGFPGGTVVNNPPANVREPGSIPRSGRSPGGGHSPLQSSCLANPMDRGVWWATVHRVTKSWTQLKQLSTHMRCVLTNHCWEKETKSIWLYWDNRKLLPGVF